MMHAGQGTAREKAVGGGVLLAEGATTGPVQTFTYLH